MINFFEVNETNKMVEQENLDVRTITIGISLLECIDSNLDKLNENIYNRITTVAKDLAAVGEKIEHEFGIPIVIVRTSKFSCSTILLVSFTSSNIFIIAASPLNSVHHIEDFCFLALNRYANLFA